MDEFLAADFAWPVDGAGLQLGGAGSSSGQRTWRASAS